MTPAPFAYLGGAAGQKNHRVRRRSRVVSREIHVFERGVADRGDFIDTAYCPKIHAALLAKAPIREHRLELIAKDLDRQPVEIFIHRPVDKREYALVDLPVDRHKTRGRLTIMASERAVVQSRYFPQI